MIYIESYAAFLPSELNPSSKTPYSLQSNEIDLNLKLAHGYMHRLTGVRNRPRANGIGLAEMGAHAIKKALDKANLNIEDINLILFAGASFEQILPCTAAFVQKALGPSAQGIPCVDIDSTCLSFISGFEMACNYLRVQAYETIVIVNAEIASHHLNPDHLESYGLFGDGATAFILSRQAKNPNAISFKLISSNFETYSNEIEACGIHGGGSRFPAWEYNSQNHKKFLFHMDGPKLFKSTLKYLNPFMDRLMLKAKTELNKIQWIVPHQASGAAMNLIRRRLKIPAECWIDILEEHGNLISVSIPLAFIHLLDTRNVLSKDLVLLTGTGAGLGLGGVIIQIEHIQAKTLVAV